MSGAELAARCTAAAAVLADFKRETDAYLDDPAKATPRPDYSMWAWRLSSELRSVLQQLEGEAAETTAPPAAAQLTDAADAGGAREAYRGPCCWRAVYDSSAGWWCGEHGDQP
jgi:hypothetical protein